jgi:hypothetical protein
MLEAWLDPLEGQCESGGDEAIRRKLSWGGWCARPPNVRCMQHV